MESKINLKTIFLYLWFVQRNLVTCPVLSLFKLSNTNFLFKKFEKEKKSLEEVLNHWTGHGTHRTYKHSYSILCHTVSGVTKTISPVVKNLDQRLGFKSSYKICPNWNVCGYSGGSKKEKFQTSTKLQRTSQLQLSSTFF